MSIPVNPRIAALLEAMRALGEGTGLTVPPPVFTEMSGEPRDLVEGDPATSVGTALTVRFPVEARWQNPVGHMQGGMIAAAVDNVVGPLSYLVAPPSATARIALTYLAPVTPEMAHIEIEARLVERAGRQLVIDATVRGPEGQTLALARATQTILRHYASAAAG